MIKLKQYNIKKDLAWQYNKLNKLNKILIKLTGYYIARKES